MSKPKPPTRAELLSFANQTIPDVIAPDLDVLFCGINPSLYSAYTCHHFARPGNRFWPALFGGGFSDRLLTPDQGNRLLDWGVGITNLVARATIAADELSSAELVTGGELLAAKIRIYRPKAVAILGISAFRAAFNRPRSMIGPQPEMLPPADIWVLPNPSGLNAHYTPTDLARIFREFRQAIGLG
jgi:TDG/mug DNA glycosylase family protein